MYNHIYIYIYIYICRARDNSKHSNNNEPNNPQQPTPGRRFWTLACPVLPIHRSTHVRIGWQPTS